MSLEIGIKRRGISMSLYSGIPIVKTAYTPDLFYIGYGPTNSTDQDFIVIKRATVDPLNGSVTEEYAIGPWDDYLTLPYT
jgi:hypothetical protein